MNINEIIYKKLKRGMAFYDKDGNKIPAVTTVLNVLNKPQLVKWANNLGLEGIDSDEHVQQTANIGLLAHALFQEFVGGTAVERENYTGFQISAAEQIFTRFRGWKENLIKANKTIATELTVYHEGLNYAGRIDWLCSDLEGKTWLYDVKCTSGIYPEHIYQVAAYWQALISMGHKIDGGVRILRIGRAESEGMEQKTVTPALLGAAFGVFKSALSVYNTTKLYKEIEKKERLVQE